MTVLKHPGMHLVILLVLPALWLAPAQSQQPAGSRLDEEMARQESIYRSRGESQPEGYVIDRSLLSYTITLPAGFDRSLADLGPRDRWLDIGAGQGRAILDYYTPRYDSMHLEGRERRGTKARAVAISIEDRRTAQWHETAAKLEAGKIQYLHGKRLREYAPGELGRFQLITDVAGGFSYAFGLSVFMERALGALEVNGSFYTLLQDVQSERGTNAPYYPGSPYLTEIRDADGSALKVCAWLKRVTCVQVTCQLRPEWGPPLEVYHIRKTCDAVTVPALTTVHYEAGTPPERRYHFGNPLTHIDE